MNVAGGVVRDERTDAVENASYRLAYLFIAFALLLDVAYRSLMRRESPWELLAIVIVGGAISAAHQGRHKVLTGHSFKVFALTFAAAGIVAAVVAALGLLR
jgi:hypothetical protein